MSTINKNLSFVVDLDTIIYNFNDSKRIKVSRQQSLDSKKFIE